MKDVQALKNSFAYVMKSIKKDKTLLPITDSLKNKTYIVAGSSRGIGFNIAKKIAMNGGKVTIVGKSMYPNPKLGGTVYTAADEINDIVKRPACLPIVCDTRVYNQIDFAVKETLDVHGSIDGLVLNASALILRDTDTIYEKEVNLMSDVNINGSFLFGKRCLEEMKDNHSGHIISIAPPIEMLYDDDWWVNHVYYSMSKFNMTLMNKFWNKEFPNISCNTLWPRTTIATAPVRNILGGDAMMKVSRRTDIMGDAALAIFKSDPSLCNGKNYIDDEVIASLDMDIDSYRVDEHIKEKDLMPDFFC